MLRFADEASDLSGEAKVAKQKLPVRSLGRFSEPRASRRHYRYLVCRAIQSVCSRENASSASFMKSEKSLSESTASSFGLIRPISCAVTVLAAANSLNFLTCDHPSAEDAKTIIGPIPQNPQSGNLIRASTKANAST